MKKQQRLGNPSVLKSFLATSALLLISNNANALQVQSQNMEGLKSSLQSNLKSWLDVGQKSKQQEMSFSQTFSKNKTKSKTKHHKHHKRPHHQQNSLNLAQTSSKQQITINLNQLQTLLQSQGLDITTLAGQRNDGAEELTPEIEAALLAQQGQSAAAQLSPEEMAQLQAQAEKEAAEQAPPAQAAVAVAPVEQAAAPQQLSAAEQAQIEAQAQAEAAAQMQGAGAGAGAGAADQQAQMMAQAQAQAEAEVAAQQQARAGGKPPARKLVVADSDMNNHAAAVAAAADQLFTVEKPWAKMNQTERAAKLAKDAAEKKAKAEKEERENPTVDENGEHIQTVAEARIEAQQLQAMLVAGEAAVEQKIQLDQARMAAEPVDTGPVKQEEDDGHLETVEEAKAKMEAAQKAMDEGIANTENKVARMNQESSEMPNFTALADVHDTLSNMGKMRKQRQVTDLASKLGVEVKAGDADLDPSELTSAMMQRAQAAGKTEAEINAALSE